MAHHKITVSVPKEKVLNDPDIVEKIKSAIPSALEFKRCQVGPVSVDFHFVKSDKRFNIPIEKLIRRVEGLIRVEYIRLGEC